jgi:hypothetical protein
MSSNMTNTRINCISSIFPEASAMPSTVDTHKEIGDETPTSHSHYHCHHYFDHYRHYHHYHHYHHPHPESING